jgi:hypothetical protein
MSVVNPGALIGFERAEYDGGQTYGDDYLTIGGVRVLDLGFDCPSCTIIFGRIDPARLPMSPAVLASRLADGLAELDEPALDMVRAVAPSGNYIASLLRVQPRPVSPGSAEDYFANEYWRCTSRDHHPGQAYYRGQSSDPRRYVTPAGDSLDYAFHELIVPLYPPDACDAGRVQQFRVELLQGAVPTAIAISFCDVAYGRYPAPDTSGHLVLTHYLLDGHHKMRAAADEGRAITLLSLLRGKDGASTPGWWIDWLFEVLEAQQA